VTNAERALRCARGYQKIGLCQLPSRADRKRPDLPAYAEHYGPKPVPDYVYRNWKAPNIQLITGTQSPAPLKLLVVDCGGDEAIDTWDTIGPDGLPTRTTMAFCNWLWWQPLVFQPPSRMHVLPKETDLGNLGHMGTGRQGTVDASQGHPHPGRPCPSDWLASAYLDRQKNISFACYQNSEIR
jgi:hypothetical protein